MADNVRPGSPLTPGQPERQGVTDPWDTYGQQYVPHVQDPTKAGVTPMAPGFARSFGYVLANP